jgi:methylenetetrahydrofolate reductase (NADPH)
MIKQYSFELFPPKTEAGIEKLGNTIDGLKELNPEYFSVTYGAGGSTRANTFACVRMAVAKGLDVAPHLSYGADDENRMLTLLGQYKDMGVKRIVALRGDIPSGMGNAKVVYANELVSFIRKNFGDYFEIHVAAYPEIHPEAQSWDKDIFYLKQKLDAGAQSALTQYFFNPDSYFYFLEDCKKQGITQPIYPGIMPITNFQNLQRFSKACGAEIPRWLTYKMESFGDDTESLKAFGLEVVTKLCETLVQGGAPGIHFYTMNQLGPTKAILEALK